MQEKTQTQTLSEAIVRMNESQKEAVLNTEGPMLIVAGAGSGKTAVITARIAALIDSGVQPERILALTFTKKAAEEMRNRIIQMSGDGGKRVCMGTFHSVFIQFLRPFAQRLGFPTNFTILDEDDSLSTLKRCIDEELAYHRPPKSEWTDVDIERFKEEEKAYKPKTIKNIISGCKNNLYTADDYAADSGVKMRDRQNKRPYTAGIFLRYRDLCLRMGMMDFDDILLHTDILLANWPDAKAQLAGSFDYILVDEYQDTNIAQYSILQRLTWINKNICVVGDDSQSIYAFRGAKIQNIINFEKDYRGCRVVKLEKNYRSTRNIVMAANNLIDKNDGRIPKVCKSEGSDGEPIIIHTERDEKLEASYIAQIISAKVDSGQKTYNDFAVLYRTNAQSRTLEDAFVKARIPYVIYSGVSFFQRMEVKDLMAYFRLAVNPRDDESFRRVVNKPARSFGATAQQTLLSVADTWKMSLWDTATNPSAQLLGFSPRAMAGLQAFLGDIASCMEWANTKSAYEAAMLISGASGFYDAYASQQDEESQRRADNIRELLDSVKAYEEETEERNKALQEADRQAPTLAGYLQSTMLLSNADTESKDAESKVSLMTVHCAKGLEYETVFVAGMESQLFPLEIEGTQFEEEEERRLFYVAMTRAKTKLYLTRAEARMKFGQRKIASPSKFLDELKYPGRKKPKQE